MLRPGKPNGSKGKPAGGITVTRFSARAGTVTRTSNNDLQSKNKGNERPASFPNNQDVGHVHIGPNWSRHNVNVVSQLADKPNKQKQLPSSPSASAPYETPSAATGSGYSKHEPTGTCSSVVTVDPILFEYIKLFHKDELRDIKTRFGAKLCVEGNQLKIDASNPDVAEKAFQEFSDFYRKLFFSGGLKYEVVDVKKKYVTLPDMPNVFTKTIKKDGRSQMCIIGPEAEVEDMLRIYGVQNHPYPESNLASPTHSFSTQIFTASLNPDVELTIRTGDITEEQVDVIVNTTDCDLTHKEGVSKAIATAAGPKLIQESQKKFLKHGRLEEGKVVKTSGGKLLCSYVLHAIGPSKRTVATHQHIPILEKTLIKVFKKCDEVRARSVALPAVGSGRKGIHAHDCAEAMLYAIEETTQKGKTSLKDVRIVDVKKETVHEFIKVFKKRYTEHNPQDMTFEKRDKMGLWDQKHAEGSDSDEDNLSVGLSYQMHVANIGSEASGRHEFPQNVSSTTHLLQPDVSNPDRKLLHDTDETCPICMDSFQNKTTLDRCKHSFCKDCLDRSLQLKNKCPICGDILGEQTGDQPDDGTMTVSYWHRPLEGYEGVGTIVIDYYFPSGVQKSEHPDPGSRYKGTSRTAYLPDSKEGREVLKLLQRAFEARLLFTVGRSVTTGREGVVVWNDIHQKTSPTGGPQRYGYPDPTYLSRVKEELAAKGIK
ncbi:uncharacterized protein LOC106173088 [Lingula anatina]|uniref:E3 ubiquitin-protein ligase n=1 Tax=Lingula anatina TaxID=7574 RepID=A0A1S3JHB5_LINAN|nr:uncharacterized protein LOC106173088 [Lingula anatina]|eukprot:XP_013409531.1 uncharacterized protein LOC106173088 [Lingula anatina]